jgi:hypothetical protein
MLGLEFLRNLNLRRRKRCARSSISPLSPESPGGAIAEEDRPNRTHRKGAEPRNLIVQPIMDDAIYLSDLALGALNSITDDEKTHHQEID